MIKAGGLIVALCVLLAACGALKADPAREGQADQTLNRVIAGDQAGFLAEAAPEMAAPEFPAQFAQMRRLLPAQPPTSGRSVQWNHQVGSAGEQYLLVREYHTPDRVIVGQTIFRKANGARWVVQRFDFRIATNAELQVNRFTLSGKSPLQYAVLAGAIIVPLFCLVTSGFAAFRRRWGWTALSLLGFMTLQIDWATGAWSFQPLSFLLLGAAFAKNASAFAPWVFSVAVPIGAALFWGLRKNRPKPPKAPKTARGSGPEPYVSRPDDFTPAE